MLLFTYMTHEEFNTFIVDVLNDLGIKSKPEYEPGDTHQTHYDITLLEKIKFHTFSNSRLNEFIEMLFCSRNDIDNTSHVDFTYFYDVHEINMRMLLIIHILKKI